MAEQTSAPNVWGREPVMILATVQALLALGVGFGLPVTTEQMGLIMGAAAAVLGLWARQQVYPSAMVEAKLTPTQLTKLEKPLNGQ